MNTLQILEWTSAIFGLGGSFVLASTTKFSRYGWIMFLVANVAMIAFAISAGYNGLFFQAMGFTVTSLLGVYKTFVVPYLKAKNKDTTATLDFCYPQV